MTEGHPHGHSGVTVRDSMLGRKESSVHFQQGKDLEEKGSEGEHSGDTEPCRPM